MSSFNMYSNWCTFMFLDPWSSVKNGGPWWDPVTHARTSPRFRLITSSPWPLVSGLRCWRCSYSYSYSYSYLAFYMCHYLSSFLFLVSSLFFVWYAILRIVILQGMADAYLKLHPRGTAIVTQFQSRPEILVRVEKNHRPTTMSYAEAIFSPVMPRPTVESIR